MNTTRHPEMAAFAKLDAATAKVQRLDELQQQVKDGLITQGRSGPTGPRDQLEIAKPPRCCRIGAGRRDVTVPA